jgi:hypothetical protein
MSMCQYSSRAVGTTNFVVPPSLLRVLKIAKQYRNRDFGRGFFILQGLIWLQSGPTCKCNKKAQRCFRNVGLEVSWLPDLGSNQGPAD